MKKNRTWQMCYFFEKKKAINLIKELCRREDLIWHPKTVTYNLTKWPLISTWNLVFEYMVPIFFRCPEPFASKAVTWKTWTTKQQNCCSKILLMSTKSTLICRNKKHDFCSNVFKFGEFKEFELTVKLFWSFQLSLRI